MTRCHYKQSNHGACHCAEASWRVCSESGFCSEACMSCPVCRFGHFVNDVGLERLPYTELCPCEACIADLTSRVSSLAAKQAAIEKAFARKRFHTKGTCNCKNKHHSSAGKCLLAMCKATLLRLHHAGLPRK